MKMKSILATALAAVVALSSCSKEDSGTTPVDTGDQTKVNISFKLPQSAFTRVDQTASAAESTLNTISVYVFESSGAKKASGAHTTFNNTQFEEKLPVGSGIWTLKSGDEVQTTSGNAKIYVGVNVPSSFQKEYASEALLLAEVAGLAAIDNTTAAVGFTMFSTVTTANLLPLSNNSTNDYVNTVTSIDVDRVVSKVVASVESSPAATDFVKTWTAVTAAGIVVQPAITFTYDVKEYGIYQHAVKSYLAQNTSTLVNNASATGVISTHANSLLIPNKTINLGHSNDAGRVNWAGFYVGENTPATPALKGNTTYIMVATTLTLNQAAEWDTVNDEVIYIPATYGAGTSDIFMIRYEGYTFVTDNATKAGDIKAGLDAIDNVTPKVATVYQYEKGYVHFRVWLNKYFDNDYRVGRNEFIHVKVNSIADIDGNFPGYPGEPGNPTKPTEPTPISPDPSDPSDPVDGSPAALNVEIEINPWTYMPAETILQ